MDQISAATRLVTKFVEIWPTTKRNFEKSESLKINYIRETPSTLVLFISVTTLDAHAPVVHE